MGLYTNATEKLLIDSAGRIEYSHNTYLTAKDSAGTGYVELVKASTSNETVIANNKNAGIVFVNTNTSELARIDSSGRLLHNTTATGTANIIIDSQLGNGSALRLIGKSANDGSEIDFYADNNSTRLGYLEFNNTVTKLVSETNVPLDFFVNDSSPRIDTRAPRGNVYSRSEIDTRLQGIETLATALLNVTKVEFGLALPGLIPPVGHFFVDISNPPEYDFYISDGASWLQLVDWNVFAETAISDVGATGTIIDVTDIMQKSAYDGNSDNFIDVSAGGLGSDNSASQGIVTFQSGIPAVTDNYKPLTATTLAGDIILSASSSPVQILSTGIDRDAILPVSPSTFVHFRIINKLRTNTITVRDDIGGTIVYSLDTTNSAADFHWDGSDWNVIALNLV
jgi:hypothetical protein